MEQVVEKVVEKNEEKKIDIIIKNQGNYNRKIVAVVFDENGNEIKTETFDNVSALLKVITETLYKNEMPIKKSLRQKIYNALKTDGEIYNLKIS